MSDVVKDIDPILGCPTTVAHGDVVVHSPLDRYLDVITALQVDGFNLLIDVTAADYLTAQQVRTVPAGVATERFEVVVNLLSMAHKSRIRVRTQVPASVASVPSLFDLYPGSEAMEREVFDLMGISFDGHPDLTRILMPEGWEGHPLRKDYAQGRIPVQFKYTAEPYDTSRSSASSEPQEVSR